MASENLPDGLLIKDNVVSKPFPGKIWITEKAENIQEFFVLYLVKPGKDSVIISIQPGDSDISAGFKEAQGFVVK